MPLPDPTMLGAPVELPVTLTVGHPGAGAEPTPLGVVHLALRVTGLDDAAAPEGTYRLVPVDPDDLAYQIAHLLDQHAAALRAGPHAEEVPGAAA